MRLILSTYRVFAVSVVAIFLTVSLTTPVQADGGAEKPYKQKSAPRKKAKKTRTTKTGKVTKTRKKTRKIRKKTRTTSVVEIRHRNLVAANRRELLIDFPNDVTSNQIDEFSRRYGLQMISRTDIDLLGVVVIKFSIRKPLTPGQRFQLAGEPGFLVAQPNYRYYLSAAPLRQYALKMMQIPQAQKISTGNGIKIAILDSGVFAKHPAIAGAVSRSYDLIGKSARRDSSHGTGIASIIAGRNTITGVSPDAEVMSIRVFASKKRQRLQYAETYNLLIAVDWAVKNQAKILNMSFAGLKEDPLFHRTLRAASKKGLVLVASAGNRGAKSPVAYPAAFDEVIATTAIDARNRLYRRANRGNQIALAAPGVNIMVARKTRSFGLMTGTSAATAYISGAIALILQAEPDLTTQQVLERLAKSATDLGKKGRDKLYGFGLPSPFRALQPQP